MKAIQIKKYGGPEVLEIVDQPDPHPKADEVVVQVAASSVNPIDWLIRDGGAKSFIKVDFPVILGCDLAGRVVEVGADVKGVAVGDEVFAMMPHDWGAHAERVALAAGLVVKKPSSLSMVEAAAIPVVAMTALNGLRTKVNLQKGEHVLIHGASSSVGMSAVQIAKALGAHVTGVCSAASFDRLQSLGADDLVDYKTTDWKTRGETYDLVFDCIGDQPYGECKHALRGRKVHVTVTPGIGTFIRQAFNFVASAQVYGLMTSGDGPSLSFIKTLIDEGKLRPIVEKVYPMEQIAEAQELSKGRRAKGKIVLEFNRA